MVNKTSEGIEQALERASADSWNCLSHVLHARARNEARRWDERIAQDLTRAPLVGVPFVAKGLFDVKGLPTLAGGPADPGIAPAAEDALLVRQLAAAGAILVGIAHMDEYALGFLGDNPHHGRVRNPLHGARMSGGSSSGCAAAVAAGIVPFAIGSDTNGSVRVPAAFCGIYSLKPSYGHLALAGSSPLAPSLDHAGLLASSLAQLEAVWRALQGDTSRPIHPITPGFAAGDYQSLSITSVRDGLSAVREQWPQAPEVTFDHVEESLAAASLLTGFEAAWHHRAKLHASPMAYSSATAERLAAADDITVADYRQASCTQAAIREATRAMMDEANIDVLVVPVTPVQGLSVGETYVHLGGIEVKASDAAGLFTRPFSLIGFPVLTVPAAASGAPRRPPTALQLIGRPGCEDRLFAFAHELAESPN